MYFNPETLPPHAELEWHFDRQCKPVITGARFHGGRFAVDYERAVGKLTGGELRPLTRALGSALVLGALGLDQPEAARAENISHGTVKKRQRELSRFFDIPFGGRSLNLAVVRAHEKEILEWTDPIQVPPAHKERVSDFFTAYAASLETDQNVKAISAQLLMDKSNLDKNFRDFREAMQLPNITATILYYYGLGEQSTIIQTAPQ